MTHPKRITQVVPQFAPVDGVGDYALNLALWLRKEYGVETRFVVCDLRWPKREEVEGFAVEKMTCWAAAELTARLEGGGGDPVLLHYVGYGYQHRGVPLWLAEGLMNWKAAGVRKGVAPRLITNFHEIWSFHPVPWKSAFYLSPVQRSLVKRIATMSDDAVTSTRNYARRIGGSAGRKIEVVPVASNLPAASVPRCGVMQGAPLRVLIFGQTWTRLPTVQKHARFLMGLESAGMLDEVVVVGKDSSGGASPSVDVAHLAMILSKTRIKVLGQLGADEAANVFQQADLLIGGHLARDICKSGALMAAFSLGCPVVLADEAESAPLEVGRHYLSCNRAPHSVEGFLRLAKAGGLKRVAAEACSWYGQNSGWDHLGRSFAAMLGLEAHSHIPEVRVER